MQFRDSNSKPKAAEIRTNSLGPTIQEQRLLRSQRRYQEQEISGARQLGGISFRPKPLLIDGCLRRSQETAAAAESEVDVEEEKPTR